MMETRIESLGEARYPSPLRLFGAPDAPSRLDVERVLHDSSAPNETLEPGSRPAFELAGPRAQLYFEPSKVTAAIVTCGGLCPGLNDIIRGLVMQLSLQYGVPRIYGFRYGYEGLIQRYGHGSMLLKAESVAEIHNFGGTILGSSRGPQSVEEMVDLLEEMRIDIFFVVGGDGTLRGAAALTDEIRRRGLKKAIVGIPKTIDNDIMYIDKSFGFETAFSMAVQSVRAARVEANGGFNGICVLKLMGRDSGFIACYAALAGGNVDFVLIPEMRFELEGSAGLLEALHYRVAKRKSAVLVVAEGAGQHLLQTARTADASGNMKHADIGVYLRDKIVESFAERHVPASVKYIDPSYIIRSVPANAQDNVYCSQLAQMAVHAAMAGKTGMLVGRWHCTFVHLPLDLVTHGRRKVDPQGDLWHSILATTGQPARLY